MVFSVKGDDDNWIFTENENFISIFMAAVKDPLLLVTVDDIKMGELKGIVGRKKKCNILNESIDRKK